MKARVQLLIYLSYSNRQNQNEGDNNLQYPKQQSQIIIDNRPQQIMIFTILLPLYLVFHLVLGWLAYSKLTKVLKFYTEKYPHLDNLPQQWKGFIRQDKHKWDKKQILIGSFLRFPIKIIIFLQYVIGAFIIIILTIPFGSRASNKILKFYAKNYGTYLYKLVWNIKQPKDIHTNIIKTPLVISNHVCWIDTVYLIVTFYPISFLSKAEVKKIPVFGKITTNVQSIYIERNDETAREKIVKDIKQRVESFLQKAKQQLYGEIYPLIIFPEGTTSNGKSLLNFKLGAFNDLSPLTIVALKYTCDNFDVGMVEITQLEHFLLSFCLKINLNVDLKQMSAKPNEKPQEYCLRAQKQLASMTGFKTYNSGYRERLQHKKLVDQALLNQKKQKST